MNSFRGSMCVTNEFQCGECVAKLWQSWAAIFVCLLFASTVEAAEIIGRVVGVTDGDTIKVLDASRTLYKIRLTGIDAPESKQAFGGRSKQSLSGLVYGQQVTVNWEKHDRYGRTLGKVLVNGRDANLEQVRAGMAWWYRQYARDQRPEDRRLYESAENEARTTRRGLWSDSNPVPPWNWRHKRR